MAQRQGVNTPWKNGANSFAQCSVANTPSLYEKNSISVKHNEMKYACVLISAVNFVYPSRIDKIFFSFITASMAYENS